MSDTPKSYESDTPETQEAVERWRQGKINIFDEMARLERERDEARNCFKVAMETAETYKRERDEIAALVRRLFQLLETVEVSDSEREFHPTRIQSCRVMHTIELGELLPKLKEAAK